MTALSIFLLILVTIVWGSTFFIIKDTVSQVDAFHIVFVRNLLAAVPMMLVVLLRNKKSLLDKKALAQGAIIGFLLAVIYLTQTIGLKFTSSGHSAFITGSAVVIVPILLFFLWKERLYRQDIISILIVFSGLFLLTYDFKTMVNIGDIITLVTVAAYAFQIVLAGRFVKNTQAVSLIAYQFVFAALFSGIGSLIMCSSSSALLSAKSIWALLYLGIVGTLFCYFVSVWVQNYVSSLQVALIFSLEPVFAVIFSSVFAGEEVVFKELAGMGLILSGVVLYQLGCVARAKKGMATES